ncbi:MAG TPA: energy transducer TonB [Pyrinomonadaceae bacterium]|nr:energy transducer TonB [Pyrinomonadaceae bacterium]
MYFRQLSFALLTLLLAASPLAAQTQKTADAWPDWETITPEGEEFTVMMPKNPTTESVKFPYHKMELNTRLYLAKSTTGPVLAVASFSGIKSNPAQYTEFARFNSYIDAFKDFFPPKVRTKDTALTKLTLVSNRPFNGHTGRSYKISIGELNGVLHAFVTRKRFYAIVSLNTKKDDTVEEKFLSSFTLPEREPDPPKNTATAANQNEQQPQPQPGAEQTLDNQPPSAEQKQAQQQQGDEGNVAAPKKEGDPNTGIGTGTGGGGEVNQPQNADGTQKRAPINAGMLNGKAIYLPRPEPPSGANGVVLVQVLIDEQGSVIDAKAVSGPQNLHAISVNAARLARFMPTLLAGVPVQVTGTLSYNFVRSN